MYLYLYDSFLNHKKYGTTIARIETKLTDMGIGGKIIRLSPLRNLKELIAEEIGSGVKTVVVVGNDKTINEVVNAVTGQDVVLGIIPIGPDNTIATAMGIPTNEEACMTLAARIIINLDVGKINNAYFLSGVHVAESTVEIHCEQQYTVIPETSQATITVCNIRAGAASSHQGTNPQDGLLEVSINQPNRRGLGFFQRKQSAGATLIPCKHVIIKSKQPVSVVTDDLRVLKTPVTINVVPGALRMIVGKNRSF